MIRIEDSSRCESFRVRWFTSVLATATQNPRPKQRQPISWRSQRCSEPQPVPAARLWLRLQREQIESRACHNWLNPAFRVLEHQVHNRLQRKRACLTHCPICWKKRKRYSVRSEE